MSKGKRTGVVIVVAVAITAVIWIAVAKPFSNSKLNTATGSSYEIQYPDSWIALSREQLEALPESPLAVIQRKDGAGFFVLRQGGRASGNSERFAADLTQQLRKRIKDFSKRTVKIVKTRAGKAFYYSYIRKNRGTVHAIVVIPAGNRSYVINTVSSGQNAAAARQLAQMIVSFEKR